jgi:hypothetical protein
MLVPQASFRGPKQVDVFDREDITAGMANMFNHCFEATQGPDE